MVGSQVYAMKIEATYEDYCQRFSELCLCDDSGEIINDRHILSENDFFATYGLASEVLGE